MSLKRVTIGMSSVLKKLKIKIIANTKTEIKSPIFNRFLVTFSFFPNKNNSKNKTNMKPTIGPREFPIIKFVIPNTNAIDIIIVNIL
jgi:hypothetical protein